MYKFTEDELKKYKSFTNSNNNKLYEKMINIRDDLRYIQQKATINYIILTETFMLPVNFQILIAQIKYEEKEEQRRLREEMREEEKAQKEFERAQKEAEDEERRFQKALDKAKQELGNASQSYLDLLNEKVKNLEIKLKEAQERKERAISMAQMTKVGHIYIISNIGSFGENIYKIGQVNDFNSLCTKLYTDL
jgi:hypothetical protein